jgi:hypothetical protein
MKSGNVPGVRNRKSLSSGIISIQHRSSVTNVFAHKPGIKLLNGLLNGTIGVTTYAYRRRVRLSTTPSRQDQSKSSFPFLIWPDQLWKLLS